MSKKRQRNKLKRLQRLQPEVKKDNFELIFWSKVLIVLSILIYIFLIIPFTKQGVMSGHDIGAHVIYSKLFNQALSEKQFPVRMIDWVTPGLNQPLFNFYQPGFYYLEQLTKVFTNDAIGNMYLLVIFLWLLSGLFMFLWVKNLWETDGVLPGLTAAAFYVFAPYHIADVFVRAAFPEFAALTFIPGLFWATERFLSTGKRYYILLIGLFEALVVISHPPTFLMFSLPLMLFCLIRPIKLTRLICLIFTLTLGILSVGFFIIPALFEQPLIQNAFLKIGSYDFHQHFVCPSQLIWSNWDYGISGRGCNDGFSFQLGILHWAVLLGAIYYLVTRLIRRIRPISPILLWLLAVTFLGMFLTLEGSAPIWENTPFLSFLQYPWRFLAVAIFATSILAGFLLKLVPFGWTRLALFVTAITAVPLFYGWFLHPATYYAKEVFEKENLIRFTPEFGYFSKFVQVLPDTRSAPKEEATIAGGEAIIKSVAGSYTGKKWLLEAKTPVVVHLYVHYFPGWNILVDGKNVKPDYSNEFGFMEISTEKGTHQITAIYQETAIQKWSNTISLLAIASLIILVLIPIRPMRLIKPL